MAFNSGDTSEEFLPKKKHKKFMCQTKVTYEMIPYILNIPNADDLRLRDVYTDPSRDIVTFVFEGDGYTEGGPGLRLFQVGEGQEKVDQLLDLDEIIEVMRWKVQSYDETWGKERGK